MKVLIQKSGLINKNSGIFINCFIFFVVLNIILSPRFLKAQDTPVDPNCFLCQEMRTNPQLASLNSNDGMLTALILGQLTESEISLTALNWEGVTQGDVTLIEFIDILQGIYGISSPNEVLNTEFTVAELLDALVIIGDNEGTIALLNQISTGIGPGTIKLADLITANTVNGDLVDMNFDILTLVTGIVQLYNHKNVLVTNDPVSLDFGPLGIVSLTSQVVEPPHFGCGAAGSTFFSAGIRLKLEVDVIDQVFLSTSVNLLPFVNANVIASIEKISVYVDVARGMVTINSINSASQESNFDVQPGLARVFVGNIANEDFFDRSKDPVEWIEDGVFGSIDVTVASVLIGDLDINVEAFGDATNGVINTSQTVPFDSIFGSSSTAIAELMSDLSTSANITITSDTPIVGDLLEVVNSIEGDVLSLSNNLLFNNNTGIVYDLLDQVVDPLLKACGIGIGQVILTSDNINENCYDFGDAPWSFSTTLGQDGPRHLINGELYLGNSIPGAKNDGTPDDGAALDTDDDGLVNFDQMAVNNEFSVTVNYNNSKSDSALIIAWLDFNGDGVFDKETEQSIIPSAKNAPPMSNGVVVLTWDNLPSNWALTSNVLRVRISSDDKLNNISENNSIGLLMDGEVEDYLIQALVLDVELLSFTAKKNNEKVYLNWSSNAEINFAGYAIERSVDGFEFETIGWVKASSEYFQVKYYEYIDSENFKDRIIYYRLKMIDLDESYQYSSTELVQFDNNRNETLINVFPNPLVVGNNLTVNSNDELSYLKIFNINGVVVQTLLLQEEREFSIPIEHLDSGVYVLQFTTHNGEKITNRLVVN